MPVVPVVPDYDVKSLAAATNFRGRSSAHPDQPLFMASNPVHRYVSPEMPLPSNDPPATNKFFCWQILMYSKWRMSTLVVPSIALYLTARKVITVSFRAYSVSG